MNDKFENTIHKSLHQYLLGVKEVDEMLPDCPDVMEKWGSIGQSYIPDGAREFRDYPVASILTSMPICATNAATTPSTNIYVRMC